MKDRITDLVFDEIASVECARLMAEVDGCRDCRALYHSMAETLTVFDRAVEAGLPEEDYWAGYNERLRARLTEDARPTFRQRMLDRLMSFNPLPSLPLAVRAALALIILIVALWFALPRSNEHQAPSPPEIVKKDEKDLRKNPEQKPAPEDEMIGQGDKNKTPGVDRKIAQKPKRKSGHVASIAKREEAVTPVPDQVPVRQRRNYSSSLIQRETARHIEMTEMLLRAFRNVSAPEDASALDVSYEKQMSKELLSRNMLLRRSTARKRDLKVGELLLSVEPVLLDIANLPDNPSQEDVRAIKGLMQRQAIIAELQFHSARASSRSNR
ncbi:MAG: hypothetical protein L0229_13550 [Blastocatellia bacterium]|nr:hypothetical protein [Blastocatellia bacterium]